MAGDAKEQALVLEARGGNAAAFEVLVKKYYRLVFALALARLSDCDAAEDLTQEVFLRVYLNLDKLRSPQYFSAWLTQLTRNLATDWARRGARASRLLPMVPISEAPEAEDAQAPGRIGAAMEEEQTRKLLQEALSHLPVDQREIVLLHYAEELSLEEIGRRTNRHPSTIGRQLRHALGSLRGNLDPLLHGSARSLRAPERVAVRTIAVIGATALLSQSAKAALASAAVASHPAGAFAAKAGFAAALPSLLAGIKTTFATIVAGGKAMGMAKGAIVGVAAIAAIAGGVTFCTNKKDVTSPQGGGENGKAASSIAAPDSFKSGGAIEGAWLGTLKGTGTGDLRIVFNLRREANGTFSATLDSIDQGQGGLPCSSVNIDGDRLVVEVPLIKGRYDGKRTGNDEITGTWTQGIGLPLILTRTFNPPPVKTPTPRTEVQADPATFDQYVGQYSLAPDKSIVVTHEGDTLMAQVTGQPKYQIFPEGPDTFFWKVVDAQIVFTRDASGAVTEGTLNQANMKIPAKKIK